MLLSEQFVTNAVKNLAKPAFRSGAKEINYTEIRNAAARLSYLYQNELKSKNEVRVAFMTRNAPAVFTTFLALSNNRMVTIPVDPDVTQEQLASWIREADATHVAVTSDTLMKVRDFLQKERLNLPIIEIEKKHGGEYDTSFSPQPDNRPTDMDKILLLRTEGTTQKPRNVIFNHKQLGHAVISLKSPYRLLPTDRFLTSMSWANPFAFLHGFLLPLMTGATCVVDQGLQGADLLNFIVESRVTRLIGTPQFFTKLIATLRTLNQEGGTQRGLPGVKSITVGLGYLSEETKKAYDDLRITVCHTYGQTEAGWTLTMQDAGREKPSEETYRLGAVGRALPGNKYKVIDSNGDEIVGKERRSGQLCVMTPATMTAYLGLEKETKNKIRGTWLYTEDMAELEGDGDDLQVNYIGRKEDVWMDELGPVSIHPVHEVLRSITGVEDAAGFVLKRSNHKPTIVCAVVKTPGNPLSEKQILDSCRGKLPDYLVPTVLVFTDFIPRDPGGNINGYRLRAQFSGIAG
jgi:fatty-acyl-CoA synthase